MILLLLALAVLAILVASSGVGSTIIDFAGDGGPIMIDPNNIPVISHHIEATNPATWPTGDNLWNVCVAIAFAEGYNVANSNPARLNNPGDISDGASTYGSEFHSGSNITHFPNPETGWGWLYAKLRNISIGGSAVYQPDWTFNQIGQKWAPPNWKVWAANVAAQLGVDADTRFSDYVNS
jgi:hypothetical protein